MLGLGCLLEGMRKKNDEKKLAPENVIGFKRPGSNLQNDTFAEFSDFIGARTASLKSEQISDYEYASKILYLKG